jgi:predicted SAM-dependent methyltransferase
MRRLTDYGKVQRAIGAILRNRHFHVGLSRTHRGLLNVGCGAHSRSDFVNLDYHWSPGIDIVWDLRRRLPIPDRWMHGVYSEHCLEHLSYDDALHALSEFRRILVPGAVIRVVVPDAELFMRLYVKHRDGEPQYFPYVDEPRQNWTPMVTINRIFREHGHRYAWDAETLSRALLRTGFTSPTKQAFMTGMNAKLLIDSKEREVESLYIEAMR